MMITNVSYVIPRTITSLAQNRHRNVHNEEKPYECNYAYMEISCRQALSAWYLGQKIHIIEYIITSVNNMLVVV